MQPQTHDDHRCSAITHQPSPVMYTFCPDCNRQYRVHAEQLSAAQGLVICGFCGKQFNALAGLHDRPQKPPLPRPDVTAPGEQVITPHLQRSIFQEEIRSTTPRRQAAVHAADTETEFALSEALLDEEPVGRVKTRSRGWAAGALAMLMFFALQYAWFNRDQVLWAYPQLAPWAMRFCEQYHCNLFRLRDPSAIRVINRDVRLHPNYADTLLVNATMVNQSGMIQPYPKVQFTLFDTGGQILAYREFTVEEYLDRSIDVIKGMTPGQPVHFVLEVTGPTQDAVSFEFRFL